MSERKNYNSIVFLTTLSLYLGLVLAGGATPSVLAQAATTRNFDIKSEITVEDDLDKKPDEDLYASSIINLVSELDKFAKQDRFDWNLPFEYRLDDLRFGEKDNSFSSAEQNFSSFVSSRTPKDQSVFDELVDKTIAPVARNLFKEATNRKLGSFYSHEFDLVFLNLLDDQTLQIQIRAKFENGSEKSNQIFADVLTSYLARITSNSKATSEKAVAENTKVTFENNQVFIVTRLPRASIDELLAKN